MIVKIFFLKSVSGYGSNFGNIFLSFLYIYIFVCMLEGQKEHYIICINNIYIYFSILTTGHFWIKGKYTGLSTALCTIFTILVSFLPDNALFPSKAKINFFEIFSNEGYQKCIKNFKQC